jgi:hypothetical protein
MSNQPIGIEINGGGRNKVSDSNISVKGNGKGIVLNDTFDNEFSNVTVLLEAEKQYFLDLKSILSSIQDTSTDPVSQKIYKQEAITQVQTIIDLTSRESFQKKTLDLISLLSSWITIKSALAPTILPYVSELTKLAIGG